MSYIIVCKNPGANKVFAITDADDEWVAAQFKTEREAEAAARNTTVCRAWPYEIVEINL